MTERERSRFVHFPLEMVDDGRLATFTCDAEAFVSTLRIACDLSPGDFSAIPEFANPASGLDPEQFESTAELGSAIAQRIQNLAYALRRNWEVRCIANVVESTDAFIEVNASSWTLTIPIIIRDSLVLEFGNANIQRK